MTFPFAFIFLLRVALQTNAQDYVSDVVEYPSAGWCGSGFDDCLDETYSSLATCWNACFEVYEDILIAVDFDPEDGGCCCQDSCLCWDSIGEYDSAVLSSYSAPDSDAECDYDYSSYYSSSSSSYSSYLGFGCGDNEMCSLDWADCYCAALCDFYYDDATEDCLNSHSYVEYYGHETCEEYMQEQCYYSYSSYYSSSSSSSSIVDDCEPTPTTCCADIGSMTIFVGPQMCGAEAEVYAEGWSSYTSGYMVIPADSYMADSDDDCFNVFELWGSIYDYDDGYFTEEYGADWREMTTDQQTYFDAMFYIQVTVDCYEEPAPEPEPEPEPAPAPAPGGTDNVVTDNSAMASGTFVAFALLFARLWF